jgi:hypothetical protein
MTTADGVLALPQMTPGGGAACGLPVVVSDGVPTGEIVVVDAYQIAAGAGSVELDVATEASVEFQDAQTSPPSAATVLRSLYLACSEEFELERETTEDDFSGWPYVKGFYDRREKH